jgi:hypothetical protein
MRIFLVLVLLLGCKNKSNHVIKFSEPLLEDTGRLLPDFDKSKFDSLHGWNFGWEILKPINLATDQEESEFRLSKRFSPGQKALYYIWYLDEEVTNGGFIQFYWNGYRKYIPLIQDGLQLIGHKEMLEIVQKADNEYMLHKDKFDSLRKSDNWEPLYDNLKNFDVYDSIYYQIHDKTMDLIEAYVRNHPGEFVNLK